MDGLTFDALNESLKSEPLNEVSDSRLYVAAASTSFAVIEVTSFLAAYSNTFETCRIMRGVEALGEALGASDPLLEGNVGVLLDSFL
jgi:hypothetical protein